MASGAADAGSNPAGAIPDIRSDQMTEYKQFMEALAKEAGEIIVSHFQKVDKEWKENDTPLTIADTKINSLIIDKIKEKFPDHDIISEEGSDNKEKSDYVWVCDPIDGTIPFSHGVPTCVFCLALVYKGESIAGVIYDPFMDRMYFAEKGKGCLLNNKRISVNSNNEIKRAMIGISAWATGPYIITQLYQELTDREAFVWNLHSVVYLGMLVASGELSGVLFPSDTCHDGAALKIIVEEAGGKMTDLFGNEQRYDKEIKGFIASNGILHDKLVDMVGAVLK